MTKQELVDYIMNSTDEATNKPTFLVHNITPYEATDSVKSGGLQANHSDWSDISQFIPNRPRGNFFWGEDKTQNLYNQIRVEIADLDTSKLWAFPSMAAYAANELALGHEGVPGLAEALDEVSPVNYKDYRCEFHAEWIYTGDIDPSIIR